MADGHHGRIKLSRGACLPRESKRADHGPTQHRWGSIRAGAAVVEKGDPGGSTTGKGRFGDNLAVAAGGTEDKQIAHRLTALPVKGAMVSSPAALMPSRRITFQMVRRKMRRSSQ